MGSIGLEGPTGLDGSLGPMEPPSWYEAIMGLFVVAGLIWTIG